MAKRKQPRQEAKELWPGAGLWLDWRKITGAQFDRKVAPHLPSVGDTASQAAFLKRLMEHFEYGSRQVRQEIDSQDYGLSIFARDNAVAEYAGRCQAFADKVRSKLTLLEKLARIEDEEKRRAASPQKKEDATEVEPEPAGPDWNNEAIAVAIYALLRAANLPDKPNKTAMARFAHKLTGGRSEQNLRNAFYEAIGGTFREKTAADVAEQFDKMGLPKVAADVRKHFTKL